MKRMSIRVTGMCHIKVEKDFLEKLCGNPNLGRIFMEVVCYYTFGIEKEAKKILRDVMFDFYALCSSLGEALMNEITTYGKRPAAIVSLRGCKIGSVIFNSNNKVSVRIDCKERTYSYEIGLCGLSR